MIDRRSLMKLSVTAALAPGLRSRPAHAQAWPTRIVRLVVPFPPGGGMDAAARILANRLSEIWGRQVVIENKGGAGTNLGTEMAARSEPDGYTMLIGAIQLAVNRYLFPSLGYDAITDFAPVTLICEFPNLMVVPNSSPAKTVLEFIAFAKANGGKTTFASSGIGASGHLGGELFKRMAGIELTHVPYRGVGAGGMADLIAGRVDMMFNTTSSLLPTVRGGQLRALAVTSAQRSTISPEFPTVAESGLPGFDVSSWYGLFVPVKTPPAIVQKINADAIAALADPAVKARFEALGVAVVGSAPDQLAAKLRAETDLWGPVIKAAGITAAE